MYVSTMYVAEMWRRTYHSLGRFGVHDRQRAVVWVDGEVGEDGTGWVITRVDPLGPERPRWVRVVRNYATWTGIFHEVVQLCDGGAAAAAGGSGSSAGGGAVRCTSSL